MKKIVISYNTARYLYRFRIAILRALIESNYRVAIVAPWDDYSNKLHELGCDVYDIKMNNKGSNPWDDLKTLFNYRKLYREIQPDLALHFTIKPNIYGTLSARSLGVPCINMITGIGTAFIHHSWLTQAIELLYKFSHTWPYKIFFQNMDDMKLFCDKGLVQPDKVEILSSSGINLSSFVPVESLKNSEPIFLLIGRMLRDKGVGEFIEAARLLKKKYPDTRFQLLGQVDVVNRTAILKDEIISWCSEGVVEYLGETNDVRPYIAKADCIVLPSYREGLSRTLLEAASMAKLLVATDVPGCREVIDDGQTGYLCKVRDVDDLVIKLEYVLNLTEEQRAGMGRLGREKMKREFDEQVIVRRYLEVVEEAINCRPLSNK